MYSLWRAFLKSRVWIEGQTGENKNAFKVSVYTVTACYLCVSSKAHRWSIVRAPPLVFPPSLLCGSSPSFMKVPGSKGAAAAWGCLGSRGFDLWPLCCNTAPSIYTQFNTAIWVKTERSVAGRINEGACLEFSSGASSLLSEEGEAYSPIIISNLGGLKTSKNIGQCFLFGVFIYVREIFMNGNSIKWWN